jgi:putative membrane protein
MTAGGGFWWGGGPGWGLIGFLLMIAFWTLVVVIIVGLLRSGRGPAGPPGGSSPGSLRILEERYARGEIDREEFLERRAVLSGERPPESGEPTEPTPPAT